MTKKKSNTDFQERGNLPMYERLVAFFIVLPSTKHKELGKRLPE